MLSGEQQLGRYRLLKLIATGGMGAIYLAEDSSIDRQVAIKVIRSEAAPGGEGGSSDAVRLFEREAKAIAMLDHPHILPLYDYGEEKRDGNVLTYLVMPYRPEGSLASWLEQRGTSNPLTLEDVENIITQTASALQYTHDHHLIHQDVKPSNFLIRANKDRPNRPDILISDFGIARLSNMTSGVSQHIRGTPGYMAPEQWEGNASPASDQYALAVMAYELVTGRALFKGTPMQMMFAHVNTPPPPPSSFVPGLPPTLDAVLLRGLAKKPADRFPTIAAFAQAFQQAVLGSQTVQIILANPYAQTAADTSDSPAVFTTLAISAEEAASGSQRRITLPDGSQLAVAIPPGARDGQVLELNSFGSPMGGNTTGNVRLRLSVRSVPQGQPFPSLPAEDAMTYMQSAGADPRLAGAPGGGAAARMTNAGGPTASTHWQSGIVPPSPGPVVMPAPAPMGQMSTYNSQYTAAPFQTQAAPFTGAPSSPSYTGIMATPPGMMPSMPPRRPEQRSNGLLITLIVLAFLLILGGGILLYATHLIPGIAGNGNPTPNTAATAAANLAATQTAVVSQGQSAQSTATANAQGTAYAQGTADAQGTATAQASATAQANATATAQATNPYGGTLVWSDPLGDNSQGHNWDETNDPSIGTSCQFSNGAYHMIMPLSYAGPCLGEATSLADFAFQVQMQFFSAGPHFSGGGLVFRAGGSDHYYVLEIYASGQYTFFYCSAGDCNHHIGGYPDSSVVPSFHTGLHQLNTIAVVAHGNSFTFYANGQQFAGPFTDNTYSSGMVGFYDAASQGATEVVYSNAKAWQL
ncbi:MAG TPA: protein kinase [Ktedonobacteraceae bacterium]|nr:protein kinase [Ktedonobacteraceae bacterium]